MQLPTVVYTKEHEAGLVGALPPSVGELGLSLKRLDLPLNGITSLVTHGLSHCDKGFGYWYARRGVRACNQSFRRVSFVLRQFSQKIIPGLYSNA